jgi:hypothetical protein
MFNVIDNVVNGFGLARNRARNRTTCYPEIGVCDGISQGRSNCESAKTNPLFGTAE